jgi:gas vesicle protein GvpA/GvpJ/GvpM family
VSERNLPPPPPSSSAGPNGPLGRYSTANPARANFDPGRPAARESLVDVLDRVLDKGVVIAGDISISLLDIELLTIKIRLLIASADKAREMGIDWWAHDPQLSHGAKRRKETLDAERENRELRDRVNELEQRLEALLEDHSGDDGRRSRAVSLPAGNAAGRRARPE